MMVTRYDALVLWTALHTAEALTVAEQRSSEQLAALQHALQEAQQAAAAARAEADSAKVAALLQLIHT
jgi:hypothetical protein